MLVRIFLSSSFCDHGWRRRPDGDADEDQEHSGGAGHPKGYLAILAHPKERPALNDGMRGFARHSMGSEGRPSSNGVDGESEHP